MSGIYIKGKKEKPMYCVECPCWDFEYDHCQIDDRIVPNGMPDDKCPVVFVPDHGDLIDKDEIFMQLRKDFAVIERMASEARAAAKDYLDGQRAGMGKAMVRVYEHEPVIPAERSEDATS